MTAFVSLAKYSTSPATDFETLYTQTQEFITTCNGEHVRCATDMCESFAIYISIQYCSVHIVWAYVIIKIASREGCAFLWKFLPENLLKYIVVFLEICRKSKHCY